MSKFYNILKEKANNPETRDQIVFAEIPGEIGHSNCNNCLGFSYLNFYELVNYYMEEIKKNPPFSGIVFLDNSVASNAVVIAMLELGLKPVFVDISSRQFLKDYSAPHFYHRSAYKNVIDYFVDQLISAGIPEMNDDEFIICSSGSENAKPHFTVFSEKQFINAKNQYGTDGSTFYSYISSANISGFLTNVVNPLLHNTKAAMRTGFDINVFSTDKLIDSNTSKEEYLLSMRDPKLAEMLLFESFKQKKIEIFGNKIVIEKPNEDANKHITRYDNLLHLQKGSLQKLGLSIDSMMFPRDIDSYLTEYDCSKIDLSGLKHIYLAGGVNSQKTINFVRKKIPCIDFNTFVNLYGATEAGGVISTCEEATMKSCYIDASNVLNGEIIYTFNRYDFFKISNGTTTQINARFNDETFIEYIPVSETKIPGVTVSEKFNLTFNDIEGNPIRSTDLGVYINDQLYVLGRKSAAVNINGKSYFMDALEAYISKELDVPSYCIYEDDCVYLFINCGNESLEYKLDMYKKALNLCANSKKFRFSYPIILDSDSFPKIKISGKISRAQLKIYKSAAGRQHVNFKLRDHSKKELLDEIIKGYFSDYEITRTGTYGIKLKPQNKFFFDLGGAAPFFDVVSFDDINGEITLKFNDNYIFDISTYNLLTSWKSLLPLNARDMIIARIMTDGVHNEVLSDFINMPYDFEPPYYYMGDPIRFMRLRLVSSLLGPISPHYRLYFLLGVENGYREMHNNEGLDQINEFLGQVELLKSSISLREMYDRLQEEMERYSMMNTYAPMPPSLDF